MRLIDADKVVRYTCTIDRDHDYDVYDIEHAPTVDAIPISYIKNYLKIADDPQIIAFVTSIFMSWCVEKELWGLENER